MIKTTFFGLVLVLALTVLQTTWLQVAAIYSVVPDLPLIVLVYISFKNTTPQGQLVGFISGFFQDSISVMPLGTTSFIRTMVAFAFNSFSGKFYIDKLLMPLLFGSVAVLMKAVCTEILFVFFSKFNVLSYSFLSRTLWIEVVYTAVLTPIVFFLLGLLDRLLIKTEKRL